MKRPKILVVDDDASICRALSRMFRKDGFDVRTEADGRQGLATALFFAPDIVITDMRMPAMSGREMLVSLRKEGFESPCILLSGYHDIHGSDLRRLGIAASIGKPVDANDLRAIVTDLLAKRPVANSG